MAESKIAAKGAFGITRWTVVLRAKGEGVSQSKVEDVRREALSHLVETYWTPLYFFLRRKGHREEDAQDLTQSFFTAFIEKDFLKSVQREKGRFRTFLLVALEHFLANEYDKARAQKRGGGRKILSLDFDDAERRYAREPATDETPERLYLKKWARALTTEAMRMLEEDFKNNGKGELFKAIQPHLAGGEDYDELAKRLKMSVSNVKVTVHRARKKYRDLLRDAVRDTVRSEAEVEIELKEIISCL
ncbi:MAG TPA: sigma-70 family RNA polymerase sigma factor [Planctomycetota bacterium]|nr:sigma-70 family RNA polymerase sigma factor [Planctomycetota bacterium]